MKTLKKNFDNTAERNPNLSSYMCFAKTITGRGFNKRIIHQWFNKLVEKDDYAKNEKKTILEFLVNLTTPVRNV